MTATSVAQGSRRSTRRHRCDEEFLGLLEEDFGVGEFVLRRALLDGVPAPKKQAIEICEWAATKDDPDAALKNWAKKNGRGAYDPRNQDGEPATFGGREAGGV